MSWSQFRKCDDLKMTEVCLTTCNHGYFMKDNPETSGFMTFANHYDWRILYNEQLMAQELNLKVGYFDPVRNNNLKGIIMPHSYAGGFPNHFRLRVRMHYCTNVCPTCISLEIKPPQPLSDYLATTTSSGLQYCFPKKCPPLDLNPLEDTSPARGLREVLYSTMVRYGPCTAAMVADAANTKCTAIGLAPTSCPTCACGSATPPYEGPNDPVRPCDRNKNYFFHEREHYSQASFVCKRGYR